MPPPNSSVELLSRSNGISVELLHHADDPCVWIVRESKKLLWFRWKASTVWFFTREQAVAFAQRRSSVRPL